MICSFGAPELHVKFYRCNRFPFDYISQTRQADRRTDQGFGESRCDGDRIFVVARARLAAPQTAKTAKR
jgi:hypothetical protein